MARRGRKWGNALGGYKAQNRKGGKFSSGFNGFVASSPSTPASRRVATNQRYAGYQRSVAKKKTEQRKKIAKVVGGAAVLGAAGATLYVNREAIGNRAGSAALGRSFSRMNSAGAVNSSAIVGAPRHTAAAQVVTGATGAATVVRAATQIQRDISATKTTRLDPNTGRGQGAYAPGGEVTPGISETNPRAMRSGSPVRNPEATTQRTVLKVETRPDLSITGVNNRSKKGVDDVLVDAQRKQARQLRGSLHEREGSFYGGETDAIDALKQVGVDPGTGRMKRAAAYENMGTSNSIPQAARNYQRKAAPEALAGVAKARAAANSQRNANLARKNKLNGVVDSRPQGIGGMSRPILPVPEPVRDDFKSVPKKPRDITHTRRFQPNQTLSGTGLDRYVSPQRAQYAETIEAQAGQVGILTNMQKSTYRKIYAEAARNRAAEQLGGRVTADKMKTYGFQQLQREWDNKPGMPKPMHMGNFRSTNDIAGDFGSGMLEETFYGGSVSDLDDFIGIQKTNKRKNRGR